MPHFELIGIISDEISHKSSGPWNIRFTRFHVKTPLTHIMQPLCLNTTQWAHFFIIVQCCGVEFFVWSMIPTSSRVHLRLQSSIFTNMTVILIIIISQNGTTVNVFTKRTFFYFASFCDFFQNIVLERPLRWVLELNLLRNPLLESPQVVPEHSFRYRYSHPMRIKITLNI